jgi:hypothetical protein
MLKEAFLKIGSDLIQMIIKGLSLLLIEHVPAIVPGR